MPTNQMILLKRRPVGMPTEADFELSERRTAELADGEALVKTLYLSLDPYMRGIMDEKDSYIPPVKLTPPACRFLRLRFRWPQVRGPDYHRCHS